MNMYMDKYVTLSENFSGVFGHYSSILLSHFRETVIGNDSNYKPGKGQESKKTKQKENQMKENREQKTGTHGYRNTKVGHFCISKYDR